MKIKGVNIYLSIDQEDWVKLAAHKDEPLNSRSNKSLEKALKKIQGLQYISIDISENEIRTRFSQNWNGFQESLKEIEKVMSNYGVMFSKEYMTI